MGIFFIGCFVGSLVTSAVMVAFVEYECGDCRGKRSEQALRKERDR